MAIYGQTIIVIMAKMFKMAITTIMVQPNMAKNISYP